MHKAKHTFAAQVDAEGWLAAERRKIDLGTWGATERSDGITLAKYADRWLEQRRLRPRTRQLYRSLLDRLILPELGDVKLAKLSPAQVRAWHSELGTETPTRNAHAYSLLHGICATAVQDEMLDGNPCRIAKASHTSRRHQVDVLTPAELDKLAGKMPKHLQMSVTLAAWCGLRWGETSELRRKDIEPDCSAVHVRRAVTYRDGSIHVGEPKTSAGIRTVNVPPHIRPALKRHLKEHVGKAGEALLFTGKAGGHVRHYEYQYPWEKARAAIGKPNFRVHDLRHVGAVLAAQSGATTAELMHRLGHTTPAMALRYQHVAENRDAGVAERMSKLARPQHADET
ncbi:tyrosine-type recombinase/integrase [Mycolicibacter senuensis]|uniref:tyrosine-type recombinase/integrase n=1 Tax=Mycolicibacter senuensis TaxID=386913 RepID=UPI002570D5FD|nr:site-specific integrase [Mycolicibacter senuensis]